MRAWIGKSILLIAAIHTIFGFIVFRPIIADLFTNGVFNTVNGQLDRESVFWFIMSGLSWFLLGGLVNHFEKFGLDLPGFFGWGLLVMTLLGIVVMPISGFWLLFVPSLGAISGTRRKSEF